MALHFLQKQIFDSIDTFVAFSLFFHTEMYIFLYYVKLTYLGTEASYRPHISDCQIGKNNNPQIFAPVRSGAVSFSSAHGEFCR